MIKFYLLLFGIVGWTTVFSQNFEWLNHVNVSSANYPDGIRGREMDLDEFGNLVIAGAFNCGLVDFDQGPGVTELNSVGNLYDDLFVMKVDQNGNFMWANRFGGAYRESYQDVTVDGQNFIYTTGIFKEAVDFLPSVPAGYQNDVFVQKLDSVGNQIWAKHFKGVSPDYPGNVSVDNQANVYVSGVFQDSVDFDPGINEYFLHANSNGLRNSFIVKLNSNGDFQWAQKFGSNSLVYNGFCVMQVDNNDDIVVAGYLDSVYDFDPGPATLFLGETSKKCGFVIKIDGAGNLIWGKDLLSKNALGRIECLDLTIDPLNNIALMGSFHDSVDFNPGVDQNVLHGTSHEDLFIVNLNSIGEFNWAKRIGPSTPLSPTNPTMVADISISARGVTSDLMGNIYATGVIMDSTDFDGGVTDFILDPGISFDQFIVKYDHAGEFNWALKTEGNEQVSAAAGAYGFDIRIGPNEEVYTTGHFGHEVDFDPGIGQYMAGQLFYGGIFILALNQAGLGIDDSEIVENFVYPNPTSDYVYLNEVAQSIVVLNASGQIIATKSYDQFIDLSAQSPGLYTLLLDGKPHRVIKH